MFFFLEDLADDERSRTTIPQIFYAFNFEAEMDEHIRQSFRTNLNFYIIFQQTQGNFHSIRKIVIAAPVNPNAKKSLLVIFTYKR